MDIQKYYQICVLVEPIFEDIKNTHDKLNLSIFDFQKIKHKSLFYAVFYESLIRRFMDKKFVDGRYHKYHSKYHYLLEIGKNKEFTIFMNRLSMIKDIQEEIENIRTTERNRYIINLIFQGSLARSLQDTPTAIAKIEKLKDIFI